MPSMVTTFLPWTADTGIEHDRTASPSTWAVRAPQAAMPQPYLVPVSPNSSLIAHSSGVSGSTPAFTCFPFKSNAITITLLRADSNHLRRVPLHLSLLGRGEGRRSNVVGSAISETV